MLDNKDVFDEIIKSNDYGSIFPDEKLGMVVLWLYDRTEIQEKESKQFKEDFIKKGFKEIYGHKNIEHEDYSDRIENLLKYFLTYDDEEQLYFFKTHALEFCLMAYKLTQHRFTTSDIVNICRNCRDLLVKYRDDEEYNLEDWFGQVFEKFKLDLRKQTDYLDNQITHSIQDLSKRKLENVPLRDMFREFNKKMDEIKGNYEELGRAYNETSQIKKILKNIRNETDNDILLIHIKNTLDFFQELNNHLNVVNRRINFISPKINQLFSILNRPQFEAKVENFLRILLSKSKIEKYGSKKLLIFPEDIPRIAIRKPKNQFTIFEYDEDLLSLPKEHIRKIPNQDHEKVKKSHLPQLRQFDQQKSIETWFNKFDLELHNDMSKEKSFSPFFFEILNNDWQNFELATNVAYRVLKNYSNHDYWQIEINTKEIVSPSFKNLKIWEMRVFQKS